MSAAETIRDFARYLATATATAGLYRVDHPQVAHLCEKGASVLEGLLFPEGGLSLLFIEDELVADGQSLGRSLYTQRLSRILHQWGVGHLKLLPGLNARDLQDLVGQLASGRTRSSLVSGPRLRLGRLDVRYRRPEDAAGANLGSFGGEHIPEEELARFAEICDAVRRRRKLHVVGISEIVARFVAAFTHEAGSFLALAPLRQVDEYTFVHSINVCTLNLAQAMAMGIEGQLLHDIGVAAMLHDLGKLFIPEELITRNGPLNDEEWALMRQHPVRGARYLVETPGVPRLAVIVAYEHHMGFSGGGYPARPAAGQPHLCSQITMISDCFDAMRTTRSYRPSMEVRNIAEQLKQQAGSGLNPRLVEVFLRFLDKVAPAPSG